MKVDEKYCKKGKKRCEKVRVLKMTQKLAKSNKKFRDNESLSLQNTHIEV